MPIWHGYGHGHGMLPCNKILEIYPKLAKTRQSHIKSDQPGSHVFRRFLGQLSTDFHEIW